MTPIPLQKEFDDLMENLASQSMLLDRLDTAATLLNRMRTTFMDDTPACDFPKCEVCALARDVEAFLGKPSRAPAVPAKPGNRWVAP